jgi:hypothetical protein
MRRSAETWRSSTDLARFLRRERADAPAKTPQFFVRRRPWCLAGAPCVARAAPRNFQHLASRRNGAASGPCTSCLTRPRESARAPRRSCFRPLVKRRREGPFSLRVPGRPARRSDPPWPQSEDCPSGTPRPRGDAARRRARRCSPRWDRSHPAPGPRMATPAPIRDSTGISNSTMTYDFAIVGSGFGGSVSALRLAEKGYRVVAQSDHHRARGAGDVVHARGSEELRVTRSARRTWTPSPLFAPGLRRTR